MHRFTVLWVICLAPLAAAQVLTVEALLDKATRAAQTTRDPQTRALCLAEIAAAWANTNPGRYETTGEMAAGCARLAQGRANQVMALRTVALRLAPHDAQWAGSLLEEATALATKLHSIEYAVAHRELALAAHRIGADNADALTSVALKAARELQYPTVRVACLRDLAVGLLPYAPEQCRALLNDAREALDSAPDDEPGIPFAQAELAAAWAPFDLAITREIIRGISDDALRPLALAMAAAAVAPANPDHALSLSQDIPEGPARARVIAAATAAMPAELAATAGGLASVALRMLGGARGEAADETRVDIAVALARHSPEEALALARSIDDLEQCESAVVGVASRMGEADPAAAIELLNTVDNPVLTDSVLAQMIVRRAQVAPEEATAQTRELFSRRLRVETYLGIAAVLASGKKAP